MTALKLIFCLSICCMEACLVTAQTINDTKTLTEDHLQGYNKYVRPVANQSEAVDVQITLFVLSIQEFDEVQETLSVVGILAISWHDASMVWNPGNYNGVSDIHVAPKDVWVPNVILTNPAEDIDTQGKDWQTVHYFSDGSAFWSAGTSLKTTCSVNMLYYPFDTQECDIIFYPWGYGHKEVEVKARENGINFQFYAENSAWSVAGSSSRSELVGHGSQVTFTMKIKRKPGFVVVNVLLPILFLSLINVLVFILPVESGERVSYCITVLLSIAVFMTIVSDTLPKNSEPIPIIAYILMLEMILTSLTTLAVILNIKMYYKTTPVPKWLQNILKLQTFQWRRKIGDQTQESQESDVTTVEKIQAWQKEEMKIGEENGFTSDMIEHEDHDARITWQNVSASLDKLAFCVLLSATVLSFAFFILTSLSSGQ